MGSLHGAFLLLPEKFDDGADLGGGPLSVFGVEFLVVEFEEGDVFGGTFGNFLGLLGAGVGEIEFLDLDVVEAGVGHFLLVGALGMGALLGVFEGVLAGGGEGLEGEGDGGGIEIAGFLLVGHGFPFLDDFPDDVGFPGVGEGFFELGVPFPGVVSVGVGEGAGTAAILS